MPFTIVRNDITKMNTDAIVNAANTGLKMGGGVCGAIFRAAGAAELQAACDKLAPIKTGEAVITPGFRLAAKYIIHTAGPVYHGGTRGEENLLRSAYFNSLKLAVRIIVEHIFSLISAVFTAIPKLRHSVATDAIQEFLADYDIDVSLVVFDKDAFELSEELLGEIEAFIDENYVKEKADTGRHSRLLQEEQEALHDIRAVSMKNMMVREAETEPLKSLDDLIGNLDESFSQTLLRLIDAKGMTDVEVYKRANMDRKLFSKIRNNINYMPSKRTAVALAVALKLTLNETMDLLERAGYALSDSRLFDVIVKYFIINGKYNIFEINEVLFKYDQPLLG